MSPNRPNTVAGQPHHWLRTLAVICVCLTPVKVAAGDPLNILFMGNSYTIANDLAEVVSALAVADGYAAPLIVLDLKGGRDVAYHVGEVIKNPQNNVAHPSIQGKTFDFSVLQGHSQEATSRQDPINQFIPDSIAWADAIRSSVAGANSKVVLYETWARLAGHDFYPDSFADPKAMQGEIRANYEIARDSISAVLGEQIATRAPAGDAFELAEFSSALYDEDQAHASVLGSSLAAMVIYRTLYSEDVSDISYNAIGIEGITEAQWVAAQTWADSVTVASLNDGQPG